MLCRSFFTLARKASDVQLIGDIKHVKNIVFLQVYCYGFSRGWKSLYNTVVYRIKGIMTKFRDFENRRFYTG